MTCSLCGKNQATIHINALGTDLCERCHDKMVEIFNSVQDAKD